MNIVSKKYSSLIVVFSLFKLVLSATASKNVTFNVKLKCDVNGKYSVSNYECISNAKSEINADKNVLKSLKTPFVNLIKKDEAIYFTNKNKREVCINLLWKDEKKRYIKKSYIAFHREEIQLISVKKNNSHIFKFTFPPMSKPVCIFSYFDCGLKMFTTYGKKNNNFEFQDFQTEKTHSNLFLLFEKNEFKDLKSFYIAFMCASTIYYTNIKMEVLSRCEIVDIFVPDVLEDSELKAKPKNQCESYDSDTSSLYSVNASQNLLEENNSDSSFIFKYKEDSLDGDSIGKKESLTDNKKLRLSECYSGSYSLKNKTVKYNLGNFNKVKDIKLDTSEIKDDSSLLKDTKKVRFIESDNNESCYDIFYYPPEIVGEDEDEYYNEEFNKDEENDSNKHDDSDSEKNVNLAIEDDEHNDQNKIHTSISILDRKNNYLKNGDLNSEPKISEDNSQCLDTQNSKSEEECISKNSDSNVGFSFFPLQLKTDDRIKIEFPEKELNEKKYITDTTNMVDIICSPNIIDESWVSKKSELTKLFFDDISAFKSLFDDQDADVIIKYEDFKNNNELEKFEDLLNAKKDDFTEDLINLDNKQIESNMDNCGCLKVEKEDSNCDINEETFAECTFNEDKDINHSTRANNSDASSIVNINDIESIYYDDIEKISDTESINDINKNIINVEENTKKIYASSFDAEELDHKIINDETVKSDDVNKDNIIIAQKKCNKKFIIAVIMILISCLLISFAVSIIVILRSCVHKSNVSIFEI